MEPKSWGVNDISAEARHSAGPGECLRFREGAWRRPDDFSSKAVQDVATVYNFYATTLHLLGLDHERLSYYHNGIERRLTDVHGKVIREVLAEGRVGGRVPNRIFAPIFWSNGFHLVLIP